MEANLLRSLSMKISAIWRKSEEALASLLLLRRRPSIVQFPGKANETRFYSEGKATDGRKIAIAADFKSFLRRKGL